MFAAVEKAAKDEKAAQAQALYCVGIYYLAGTGVEKDDKEAAKYFLQSAEKGLANAQLQASQCYFDAVGVAESPTYDFSANFGHFLTRFWG